MEIKNSKLQDSLPIFKGHSCFSFANITHLCSVKIRFEEYLISFLTKNKELWILYTSSHLCETL